LDGFRDDMARLRELANGREVIGSLWMQVVVGRTLSEANMAAGAAIQMIDGTTEQVVERIRAYGDAGPSLPMARRNPSK
jgi:hypothetical protein